MNYYYQSKKDECWLLWWYFHFFLVIKKKYFILKFNILIRTKILSTFFIYLHFHSINLFNNSYFVEIGKIILSNLILNKKSKSIFQ